VYPSQNIHTSFSIICWNTDRSVYLSTHTSLQIINAESMLSKYKPFIKLHIIFKITLEKDMFKIPSVLSRMMHVYVLF